MMCFALISVGAERGPSLVVHTVRYVVLSLAPNSRLILLMTLTQALTGHKTSFPDRECDRFSIFAPFFWSVKVMDTKCALSRSLLPSSHLISR